MTTERVPLREEPLVDDAADPTPWALAQERLANPEPSKTSWLATVRPDGGPHGDQVFGPKAPTAGPPPYSIYRMVPSKAFGLPGMFGMEQFDPADLPKPTRWEFDTA